MRDYVFEIWVCKHYVYKNPRHLAITERMARCFGKIPDTLIDRYRISTESLTEMYMNDPKVKREYKAHQAIIKMLETNI